MLLNNVTRGVAKHTCLTPYTAATYSKAIPHLCYSLLDSVLGAWLHGSNLNFKVPRCKEIFSCHQVPHSSEDRDTEHDK